MKKKTKELLLAIIGVFFLLLSAVGAAANIMAKTPYNLIWFCNNTSLILGLAFLFKSKFWVSAELAIGFFPQMFWSVDFLGKLIFDKFIFGVSDYMFSASYGKIFYILSWNHVFMIPIALAGLYFLGGASKGAWKGSLLHGILLIPLSHIFYNGINFNCMHESCISFIPTTAFYKFYWPPLFLAIAIAPASMILYWAYKKAKKGKRKN